MPGCGREFNSRGIRCGQIIGGVQEVRCRTCAFAQDGESEIRRERDRDDGKLHRGGSKKPRSNRKQVAM